MSRVLLLHLDGKLPNIALMRLAAHHRDRGDDVELRRATDLTSVDPGLFDRHDRVYASAIFERSRRLAERVLRARPDAVIGGTGVSLGGALEDIGVTTLRQDYSVYPRFRPSIGFTQRGCRLKCSFCVVPRKEGAVRGEQTIADLWRGEPHARELHLLDNDFFGQPAWRDRIREIREGGFRVCFSQGINARALDEETAEALASVDYRDDSMKVRRLYTAWDNRKDEARVWALDRRARSALPPSLPYPKRIDVARAGNPNTPRDPEGSNQESIGHDCYGSHVSACGHGCQCKCMGCLQRRDRAPAKKWPPANDPRFTFGLMYDVIDVLARHGYRVTAEDRGKLHMRVQDGLYQALYGEGSCER